MGGPARSKTSSSHSPLGLTSLANIHIEANVFLEKFFAKGGLEELVEERKALVSEIGKLVNERLDVAKREGQRKIGKKPIKPIHEDDIPKVMCEKFGPYIIYPEKRIAYVNLNASNLAQDLRRSLGLVEEASIHLDDSTFNKLMTMKRENFKLNFSYRTKEEFILK